MALAAHDSTTKIPSASRNEPLRHRGVTRDKLGNDATDDARAHGPADEASERDL